MTPEIMTLWLPHISKWSLKLCISWSSYFASYIIYLRYLIFTQMGCHVCMFYLKSWDLDPPRTSFVPFVMVGGTSGSDLFCLIERCNASMVKRFLIWYSSTSVVRLPYFWSELVVWMSAAILYHDLYWKLYCTVFNDWQPDIRLETLPWGVFDDMAN